MKKLLLILLCMPLMFSCGENEEKNNTEEGESNKEKLHNTETANSRIEEDNGSFFLRNTSKNEKFQFTISIFLNNCDSIKSNSIISALEINKIITLNPGEKKEIGTSCVYYDLFDELFLGIRGYSYGCEPCNDTSKITYSVMGELKIE
jgi:hypothetical protein